MHLARRRFAWALVPLAAGALAAAPLMAAPISLSLDFGPNDPAQKVQKGFQGFSIQPNGVVSSAKIYGPVWVTAGATTSNPAAQAELIARDRGAPANRINFTYSDLMRDFVGGIDNANAGPGTSLVVDGLSANTR